ncbi:hypothetical protein BU23DRAFT_568772 [Bimuria novae-zelandiae CBS 107.79]|uniref:Uncharacterized protein n=1 Tax=Bimuria novae-zelandiae CBS 107.79 TaxID=1447943 RepID=A0A6A5V745_9PLEO|nr:hypothetical protein BU23DRAFT_568772 [Bimuria novae-zelandiae CBS 107.79]
MLTAPLRAAPRSLAATATLLGASAVGLGFGREAKPPYPSKKRKAIPAQNEPDRLPMQAAVQTTTLSTTTAVAAAPPSSAPFLRPLSARIPTSSRASHETRPAVRRRMTSIDPASQPLPGPFGTGYTPASDLNINEQEPAGRPQSRRASWIKRLSTISNSQPSSRDTSPGPLSPSVSCSNGSMAFSHDGSTAPMLPGERPPAPLPPNKLVKRSSSVHTSRDNPAQHAASRLPSFRRPATSHQRSATLQYQTALLEMTVENPSSDEQPLQPSTDSEVEYTQYFTTRVKKESTLSKRKGALSSNARAVKRIVPDVKLHRPTLLLARSISPGAASHVVEDSESEDGESLHFVSRPGTPFSLAAAATDSDSHQPSDSQHDRSSTDHADTAARARRSFSISNLLSPGSNAKKLRTTELPGAKLVRRISQRRVSSDPLATMEKTRSSTAHGESEAASGRRALTGPALARREISTSSGPAYSGTPLLGALVTPSSSSPLSAPLHRAAGPTDHVPASMPASDVKHSPAANNHQPPPSPTVAQTAVRLSRNSMAPSEQASTLVGSDNDARGAGTGDEDEIDVQSETVFDSLRTGGARSTSGARGPRIETIFDESPPSKVKVTALRDLLPKGTFREQALDAAPGQQSIAEEEESLSTPIRTIVPDRSIRGDSPTYSRGTPTPRYPDLLPSSPPDMPKPLNLGTLEWDSRVEDDGSSSGWSIDDDDEDSWGDLPPRLPATLLATPVSLRRRSPQLFTSRSSSKPATPQHLNLDNGDRDARSSIFDWSEQKPADKSSGNRTPPRPSTVHGKKDADRRGSRAVGRRVPSGLHARSQSVPVVPDATGKRSTVVTNKFGTWGVGSKGVTEDWNDDFDFEDVADEASVQSPRVDSGMAMVVPDHIQEQQNNVLANIGLLREWGLLIEELKEQRVRAAYLGILDGSHATMWEEVDAMIDLADQEAEHEGVPGLSPPSSPGFDEVAFDDVSRTSPMPNGAEMHRSGLASDALGKQDTSSKSPSNHVKRKTILPPNHQIFGPQSSPIHSKSRYETHSTYADTPVPTGRPRKDSEAKARSIIEALQKRRSTHEPLTEIESPSPSKKVPFDTATLRRIVPHVSGLNRKVKEALREAEGLYSTPSTSPNHEAGPPFSKIFPAENELSTQMKLMTVM